MSIEDKKLKELVFCAVKVSKKEFMETENFELSRSRKKNTLSEYFENMDHHIIVNRCSESRKKCPECFKKFYYINLNAFVFEYCMKCKSHLFDGDNLIDLSKSKRMHKAFVTNRIDSRFSCPSCNERMTEHKYDLKVETLIDSCMECDLIYLEKGEFEKIAWMEQQV